MRIAEHNKLNRHTTDPVNIEILQSTTRRRAQIPHNYHPTNWGHNIQP